MAYKNGETMRLGEIRNLGINPTTILDVGAHTGQFYGWVKRVWPESVVWMVEANSLHTDTLKNLTETIKIVEQMQENMLIMDKNIQYACDKIEEMESVLNTVKGRMGL